MKIYVHTYPGGQTAYSTGDVQVVLSGENPIESTELDIEDAVGQDFVDNPTTYTVDRKKGKLIKKGKNGPGS